jgi:hypothetical protein
MNKSDANLQCKIDGLKAEMRKTRMNRHHKGATNKNEDSDI